MMPFPDPRPKPQQNPKSNNGLVIKSRRFASKARTLSHPYAPRIPRKDRISTVQPSVAYQHDRSPPTNRRMKLPPATKLTSLPSTHISAADLSWSCKMKMEVQSQEELASLQKLSDEYRPDFTGPLVGNRQSSQAIATEYANADPIYVRKTSALPQKYSHYRTVRGDGNCGWRAIAFSYFETLVRLGDRNRILEEQTRLKSLNNLLGNVGFDLEMCQDFVDETLGLLGEIADSTPPSDDGAQLLAAFNDDGKSSAIITHLKLLTSAWMKTHAVEYQPFLLDGSVADYCRSSIEPYQVEIEHMGMNALIDALIKPAGFAVEILYLDRSEGTEVNSHRFEALDHSSRAIYNTAPTIRLLYRPGHYDILYKYEEVTPIPRMTLAPVVASQGQTHVQMASRFMHRFNSVQEISLPSLDSNFDPWAEIPGLSIPPFRHHSYSTSVDSSIHLPDGFVHSPVTPSSSTFPSPPIPMGSSVSDYAHELQTRPSKYELQQHYYPSQAQSLPLRTTAFKNSQFNPAHFANEEFQPEMWEPEHVPGSGYGRDDAGGK